MDSIADSSRPNQTLLWGGALMMAAGLLRLIFAAAEIASGIPSPNVISFAGNAFYCAACVVFAVGIRGAGSIVTTSRSGRVALIGSGAALAIVGSVAALPIKIDKGFHDGLGGIVALITLFAAITGVMSAVAIARARAVPAPWQLAPVVGVALYAVATGANLLVGRAAPSLLSVTSMIITGAMALLWIAYGVIATTIARKAPRTLGALVDVAQG